MSTTRGGHALRTTTALAALAALALSVSLAAPPTAAAAEAKAPEMTDAGISDAVEDELIFEPAVRVNGVDIATVDGVVTLTGTVSTLLAKRRAAELAGTVRGVRAVVNELRVRPTMDRSDAAIAKDVDAALALDPAADSYEVEVGVDGGAVTLTGKVDSWQERHLAETVAMGVRGVTSVENRIVIDESTKAREDAEIKADVEQALRWDALLAPGLIDVHVVKGAVTLTGTVGSVAEKTRAEVAALVRGVENVDVSGLVVREWARDRFQRAKLDVERSDEAIRDALAEALVYDPRVASFDVNVEVDDGVVTLRGVVDNLKAKRAAARDARNTTGVDWVRNRIRVRMEAPVKPDAIETAVTEGILRDPYLTTYEVLATADRTGTVYLSGTVDSYFEKARADDIASRVTGVTDVRNRLAVRYDHEPLVYDPYVHEVAVVEYDWYDYAPVEPTGTDVQLARDVVDEMFWSPFVDADEVNVEVSDGVATLTGTVDSWSERAAATENAFEAGALRVVNELEVRPG